MSRLFQTRHREFLRYFEVKLGIQIDNKLNFENHIKPLCSKASQKLGALQKFSNMLDAQKKNFLFNSIIKSQFS